MADTAADFEEYCFQNTFSDVLLVLSEEQEFQPVRKRAKRRDPASAADDVANNTRTFPAHSIVLAASSSYFKAKLENWNTTGSSSSHSKPKVQIAVPAGQMAVGELLIKGIYQKQPRFEPDVAHMQLLQLLILADRYSVVKVQTAVAAAFKAMPVQELQWDTALAMLDLPPSCAEQDAVKDVTAVATSRLLQQLGDLEQVWQDQQLEQLLLGLPAAALQQLLQHPNTRVASENTVVYTIERWCEHQRLSPRAAAQLQLLQCVRMAHCTQLYVTTILSQSKLACACFSPLELAVASMWCTAYGRQALEAGSIPVVNKFPAWRAAKRPASAVKPLIKWRLPLSDLKATFEEALENECDYAFVNSEHRIVQGQPLALEIGIECSSDPDSDGDGDSDGGGSNAPGGLDIGLYLHAEVPESAVRMITFALSAKASSSQQQHRRGAAKSIRKVELTQAYAGVTGVFGFPDMFGLGAVGSWAEAEAGLREKGLVHADGCLHLKAEISCMI